MAGKDETVPLPVDKRGKELMRDPLLNKGTGFTREERRLFGLEAFLPWEVNSMTQQAVRMQKMLEMEHTPLEKYMALADLQDRNEQLYYRVLCDNLEALLPIVYTPTVGLATREYSHFFRRGRGVILTPDCRGRMADVLRDAADGRDVRLAVVTDNQSILGIGDQGVGGIAISIGKLALYCAGVGIHPVHTAPVSLDFGTDNPALLDDDLYVGWRHRRLRGEEYDSLVEEFVEAVIEVFPGGMIQWEDFRKENALGVLDKYRERVLSFNDDIQGTGAVALAGLVSALRVVGGGLGDQRILIYGAGAAGLGIARQIRAAIRAEGGDPLAVGALDRSGLLISGRKYHDAYKEELAWPADLARARGVNPDGRCGLFEVVSGFKPTVLIGSAGQGGSFTEDVVTEMARHVERPIIFPFSNPTECSEARPVDLIRWTEGRALVATGSPFDDVLYEGRRIRVGQGNNVFIFPGLGLGSMLCQAQIVSDGMISAAASALAHAIGEDELRQGLLYPAVSRLREISRIVADAVMLQAGREGYGRVLDEAERKGLLDEAIWEPEYRPYVPA